MKKILLLFLLFITIGCTAETTTETAVAPVTPDLSPANTPAEAAVIRETDHLIGASDPAVVIIEYGDFQ